jgi:hypothetical protein
MTFSLKGVNVLLLDFPADFIDQHGALHRVIAVNEWMLFGIQHSKDSLEECKQLIHFGYV